MICDRARTALTCEAVMYDGANVAELRAFVGAENVREFFGRYALVTPDGSGWAHLDVGDWIVRGVGDEWDFYRIEAAKFSKLWTPRGESNGIGCG